MARAESHPHSLRIQHAGYVVLSIVFLLVLLSQLMAQEPTTKRDPVISAVALQPGGDLMVTAGDDHVVRIWDLATGEQTHQLEGHTDWIRTVVFSQDGEFIYSAGNDGQIRKWNATQADAVGIVFSADYAIARMEISPNSTHLAVVGFSNEVSVVDLRSPDQVTRFVATCNDLHAIGFSPDEQLLAAAGRDGVVTVWNIQSREVVAQQKCHTRRVRDLCFIGDSSTLVSASEDRTLFVWNLGVESKSRTLMLGAMKAMAIEVCGPNLIAVAGTDNTIRLWDITEDREIDRLHGHTGSVTSLDHHEDRLVSGSYDTSVRLWRMNPNQAPIRSAKLEE
ncbi:MAG: WD40 repeat domain-containing protein [Pirellulaceae bacterium]